MSEATAVERSIVAAWNRMLAHQDVAPSLGKSAQEVGYLLEPLQVYLENHIPDAEVVHVFPGLVALGGPDGALGNGGSAKLKSLEPLAGGLFAALSDGTYILVTELGPIPVRGDAVRGLNLFTAKILFAKVPSIEIVYHEDAEDDVLRFIFDDLPDSLVKALVLPRA